MQDRKPESLTPGELRRRAEARLREIKGGKEPELSDVDARSLLHELQVHQIELEMQNEEIQRTKTETEDALGRYTDLYDFAPVGYLTLDTKALIIEANLAAGELLGMSRSELINVSFRFFLSRECLHTFEEFFAQVFAPDESQTCELQLLVDRKPGPYVCMEGKAAAGTAEGTRQCRAAIVDITNRKRAEQLLQAAYDDLEVRVEERTAELAEARAESERRAAEWQSFLASMGDGVLMVDPKGDVVYANEAAFEILGAPEDETFEDWMRQYPWYTLEGDPMPLEDVATVRALRGDVVKEQWVKVVSPRGRELLLGNGAAPVRDADGAVIGAITVFRDVRDRVEFESERQAILEREHRIAEILQQALIPPQRDYQHDCCRIAVSYQAALGEAEIGGDFFDVFDLGRGKLGLVVGDITGKGLLAAVRVAAVRHSIRSYAYLDPSPAAVMTRVNDALCREPEEATAMLTAFFGVIDAGTGDMIFSSAGHEPPFVRDRTGTVTEPDLTGRALGVMGGYDYPEASIQLQHGDLLVVITDGITEAMYPKHQFFGRERVADFLTSAAPDDPPEAIAEGLLQAAKSHALGKLRDDAVVMALRVWCKEEPC